MTDTTTLAQNPFASQVAVQAGNCFDMLVLKNRMTPAARCLLEAMDVRIEERPSTGMPGPDVYHLWAAEPRPRVTWLDPEQADAFIDALVSEANHSRAPEWMHVMLTSHRAGTLRDMDDGIELAEPGMDVNLVLRDLLHQPGA